MGGDGGFWWRKTTWRRRKEGDGREGDRGRLVAHGLPYVVAENQNISQEVRCASDEMISTLSGLRPRNRLLFSIVGVFFPISVESSSCSFNPVVACCHGLNRPRAINTFDRFKARGFDRFHNLNEAINGIYGLQCSPKHQS